MATGKDYIQTDALFKLVRAMDLGGMRYGDLIIEVGNSAYAATGAETDASDITVPTQLNQIVAGVAVPFDSYSPASEVAGVNYNLFIAPDVTEDTNSHRKTFTVFRSAEGAPVAGLKFAYIVIGRHFATD